MASDRTDSDSKDQHLRTDHLLTNLETRALSSGVMILTSQGAQFILNLGSIMVLARLLNPDDFGLVAMLMTVMSFLRVFREAGLSTATIQREAITHAQVSNLFWVNIALSGAAGLVLAAASPLIAWFYRESRLIPITLVLAATFPLSGLTVQHTALLARQMRFVALSCVQVSSQFIGLVVGIMMAWWGYGYWSLVSLNVTTLVATALLTYIAVPWRPQAPVRQRGTRPLVSFGANLAASTFVFSLAKGTDGLAIGRYYGSDALGLYSRAGALFNRPLEQILAAAESVIVPMLSRMQHQPERYRSSFLQFYEAMALASCFSSGLLLALAHPITLLVLGPKWERAAVILAAFSVSALCAPLATTASWLFPSQGRGRDMLLVSSLLSGIVVASIVVGLPFGPAGVALAGSIIGVLVGVPALYHLAGREGPVTATDLWRGFLRCVPVWGVVCGATFSMHLLFAKTEPLVQLAVCIPIGLLAGAVPIWMSGPLRQTTIGVVIILRERLIGPTPSN